MTEEIIEIFRRITGLTEPEVIKELKDLSCTWEDAKNVYLCSGRFPNKQDQEVLHIYGFEAWKALFEVTP